LCGAIDDEGPKAAWLWAGETYIVSTNSLLGVHLKNSCEKWPDLVVAQLCGHWRKLAWLYLSEQVRLKVPEKRQFPDEQNVQDDATRPNVSRHRQVRLFFYKVGVHVMGRPTESVVQLVLTSLEWKAKVDNLDLFEFRVKEYVV
jgi:hypothetical protein